MEVRGELRNCIVTGKLFLDTTGSKISPEALREIASTQEYKRALRELRKIVREREKSGELMTVSQAAQQLGVEEHVVLAMIYRGDIDTYSFNDPEVRDYLRRRAKLARTGPAGGAGGEQAGGGGPSFYTRDRE